MGTSTGSQTFTTASAAVVGLAEWTETYDVAANTSTVDLTLKFKTSGYSGPGVKWFINGTATVNGEALNPALTMNYNVPTATHWFAPTNTSSYFIVEAASGQDPPPWTSATITHLSDGSKSVTVAITATYRYQTYDWVDLGGGNYGYAWVQHYGSLNSSFSITLATIPRASSVTASGNTLGSAVSLSVTRYDTSLTHTIAYSFAGQTGTIVTKASDTTLSWKPDLTLATGIPSATSATCTLTCTTYSGDTQVGDATTHDFTLNVPATVKPSAASGWAVHTYVTTVPSAATIAGYVQGYSKARVTFDASKVDMTAAQSATIAHYQIVCGGVTATGADNTVLTLDTQTLTGTTASVTARVYDSRGRYFEETLSITLNAYSPPVLSGMAVARCTSGGTASESGTYWSALATLTYSAMGALNTCTLKAYIKTVGGSYDAGTDLTSGSASVLGGGLISVAATYITKIAAVDTVGNTSSSEFTIPTAAVAFNIRDGGTGAAFGKYAEADKELQLPSDWEIRYRGAILAMPTNPNLLHNWDFRNPVNQRVASGAITSGYFYDRWTRYAGTLTINSGYLAFASNSAILQFFEGAGLSGAVVTASVMISGTVYSTTGTYPSSVDDFSDVTITGFGSARLGWDANGLLYFALIADGTARNVQAVKLEMGSVSTLAYDAPVDYGTELAKCQRFFLSAGAYPWVTGYTDSSTEALVEIATPATMRGNPTINHSGITIISHGGAYSGTITGQTVKPCGVRCTITGAGFPVLHAFTGYIASASPVLFSADL